MHQEINEPDGLARWIGSRDANQIGSRFTSAVKLGPKDELSVLSLIVEDVHPYRGNEGPDKCDI